MAVAENRGKKRNLKDIKLKRKEFVFKG